MLLPESSSEIAAKRAAFLSFSLLATRESLFDESVCLVERPNGSPYSTTELGLPEKKGEVCRMLRPFL